MTATLWRLTVIAVVSVLALPIALIVAPGERSLIVRLGVLVIAGCALAFMVQLVGRAAPRPLRQHSIAGGRSARPGAGHPLPSRR